MTHDSDPSAQLPSGDADPLAQTQPVEVPRFAPPPDPRPDTRWAWAGSERGPEADPWRPAPSSPQQGTTWWPAPAMAPASGTWSSPASSATASWGRGAGGPGDAPTPAAEPEPDPAAELAPAWVTASPDREPQAAPRRRSAAGVGTVAAVALLSAVLASSGTALALNASGALTTPAAAVASAQPAAPAAGGSSGATDDSAAIISAAARLSPAVVKITTSAATTDPFGSGQTDGVGSGIIYNANGWIVTNHHVVTGTDTLTVELKDGRTFQGKVYGIDTLTDLAIVKVDATGLPVASLGSSDSLKVGQLVIAVGSPLGTYSFSVTSGIVSGKGRSITLSTGATIENLIQTDAAINPGNSGGPLADASGNVVGIDTAMADGSNGIGFAIPIDIAKPIMAQAVKGEALERPYIGIRYEMINPQVKTAEKLTVANGALIINDSATGGSAIAAGSPADAAGLKDGDVITAINGMAVDQEHPLNLLLVQFAPKDTIRLTVLRGGQTLTVSVTLGVRPDNLQ